MKSISVLSLQAESGSVKRQPDIVWGGIAKQTWSGKNDGIHFARNGLLWQPIARIDRGAVTRSSTPRQPHPNMLKIAICVRGIFASAGAAMTITPQRSFSTMIIPV